MNRLLISTLAAILLLLPFPVKAATDAHSKAPPVAQKLVREGDFAVRLAAQLKLGTAKDEAEAEDMLVHAGIAPKNGWISDYPVTPAVMGEVQESVKTSSKAGKIKVNEADADKTVVDLGSELGIAVIATAQAGSRNKAASAYAPAEADVDEYYEDEGPPVITYYAPPPDYYYLYDWDPWPFWWGGIWFPGFFVLADFDFVVVVNNFGNVVIVDPVAVRSGSVVVSGTARVVTNHVVNPRTNTVAKVDPVSGRLVSSASAWHGNAVASKAAPRPAGWSRTSLANKGKSTGRSILNRSMTRSAAGTGRAGVSGAGSTAKNSTRGTGKTGVSGTRGTTSGRGHTSNLGSPRSGSERQFEPSQGSMLRSRGSYGGGGRSYSSPSMGGGRSYSGQPMGGGGRQTGGSRR